MHPATITSTVLERILAFLAPIFLSAAGGDNDTAREAARSALACYDARTNRELRLAALAVAFSFGALDALSKAADPELTINQVMRLRGNATSLHRSADKAEQALRQERQYPDEQPEPEFALPDSISTPDLVAFAKAAPPMSRQQRRLAERQAEKLRQRRAEEARKAERIAQRRANEAMQRRDHDAMAAAAPR